MTYQIKARQRTNARKLGVSIKPSKNKGKKIDVIKGGKKVASVGAKGMNDYATYIKTKGKPFADKRKSLYLERHKKDKTYKDGKLTPGYFAKKILWT
jgi:hypothetical protein|tara:strand:- start:205 stop:495 length:291 start_codon:yes stop_codon:yes gene_type:complete